VATFSTPEEAARAGFGAKEVRFVGAAVRGDAAVVAHWVEGYGYSDTETTTCVRNGDGWVAASSGNGDGAPIYTAPDRVTFVSWGQAAEGAVAVRFRVGDEERVVPVENGFFFAVFDDLLYQEPRHDLPGSADGGARGYQRTVDHGDTRAWDGYVRNIVDEDMRVWELAHLGFESPKFAEWVFGSTETAE
jgi:hypothetical protein